MAVKILLADKSITIQKVVEMLFSGKEYQVVCVSDGEAALSQATRSAPDVVLADMDLPRVDGYTLAARFRQIPNLAQTPVILMLSRDDVFDVVRARQAGILDKIAKPFESQDLISKVRNALTAAPPRLAEPARPAAAEQPRSKQAAPSDIFDIIREAPSQADIRRAARREESVFEVEPEVEVEEPVSREAERVLPVGQKAVEEMRAGLGLTERVEQAPPAFTSFESFGADAQEYAPSRPAAAAAAPPRRAPERTMPQAPPAGVSDDMLRGVAAEAVSRIAREVLEKVAWEVIPDLAERLIREEIERLKAEK
jgi:DNA-binding response OmpR family regulator